MNANALVAAGRKSAIALWVLRIALAALFLMAASMKLMGGADIVAEFNQIGLGQWFRLFTALVELTGAVLLLWPAFSVYGALVLVCVCIGAFAAQLFALHGDVIHTIVIGAFAAAAVYFQRGRFLSQKH